jgi:hypothetical protein
LAAAVALCGATIAGPALALEAVCLPDRAAIGAGERVTVRALSDAPAGAAVQVAWSADADEITSTADPSVVAWRPSSAQIAIRTITARVTAGADSAQCTAQVAVFLSPQRGVDGNIVAAGSMLPPGVPAPEGYGLYSYILLAHRPQAGEETERVEAVLTSFLLFGSTEEMEKAGATRSQLNATFLPIKRALPDDFDQRDGKAAWLRNNYAYERSLVLQLKLRNVPGAAALSSGAVWVVSSLHPLETTADPGPLLVQDLSSVPTRLIGAWARRFQAVTTQPRLYDRYSMTKLSLDLRIAIGQAADGLDSVRGAFKLLGSSVL